MSSLGWLPKSPKWLVSISLWNSKRGYIFPTPMQEVSVVNHCLTVKYSLEISPENSACWIATCAGKDMDIRIYIYICMCLYIYMYIHFYVYRFWDKTCEIFVRELFLSQIFHLHSNKGKEQLQAVQLLIFMWEIYRVFSCMMTLVLSTHWICLYICHISASLYRYIYIYYLCSFFGISHIVCILSLWI